ncbi:MAG TPA: DUF2264 domain-containing protein [Candidatus Pelethocola excrementipullorum]|nr:DUF2264 domain-containing protein [Candidatus Pelethocola excrementipullorum]
MEKTTLTSREDFERVMLRMLNPLKPYYSEGGAQLKIGYTSAHYPDESAWMEGFSRPLWGLAPFWAGGGRNPEFEALYRKGLVSGTDPKSPEYWGTCEDYDQRLVEMASLAYTLLIAKEKIWEPLAEQEKEQIVRWLNEINHNRCCDCNWRFFNVLVNVALKKLGMPYSGEEMQSSLDFIESCYIGGGWYVDGENGQADYYIPFAMEFYGIIYAMAMKDEDPERCRRYLDRAETFGKDFVYWFAEDGSALPYGRSLTYRFAQVAFYSACIMAHIEPLPLPVMKGIIVRHMDYWLNQPIFDHAGLMTIGYCYPNLQMTESYNAPGSPYWAMKTFACLALPKEDPFWACEAAPLPWMESQKYLEKADMIIQRRGDGNVVALPGGRTLSHIHTHTEEKYAKFAYSTQYGFSVMRSPMNFGEAAPDSVLSFEVLGHIYMRGQAQNYTVTEDKVLSDWSPVPGIQVHTEIIPTPNGHKRIHIVDSNYDCKAYDAGFALPLGSPEGCVVRCLQGEGSEKLLKPDPNTNLIHSKTVIPVVEYEIHRGKNMLETEVQY